MDTPRSPRSTPSPSRWLWPIGMEHRASRAVVGTAAAIPDGQIVSYTLPERLIGPEPADCEVVLGEDYSARVLERVLRRESWWLWWTERDLLARLERQVVGGRRVRHLPESMLEAGSSEATRAGVSAWIARGFFRPFGAALFPPESSLQPVVLDAGTSLYSEVDPNFWIGVSPHRRWSPRALEEWCAGAAPASLSLEPFAHAAERLCMAYNGHISISLPEAEAAAVLGAIEQWASAHDVTLELRLAREPS